MKIARCAILSLGISLLAAALPAAAQTGSIEFTVRITPSSGLAEPVRGLPFYLLRRSFRDITRDADASVPKPDMNQFIDGLKLSKELKDWMKQNHTVTLNGDDFIRSLKPDDVLNIPEFREAYMERNAPERNFGFPSPKYKESDRTKNPAKFQREMDDYAAKVRKYLTLNPQSKDGIDLNLTSIDPSHQWAEKVGARVPEIQKLALDLTHSRYVVAQTTTDENGHAEFSGISAGQYWLSSLNIDAEVGDTRERWDAPVVVRAGATTQATLSDYDAVPSAKPVR